VCNPYFMQKHFMLTDFYTIRQRRYYTTLTYAFSHQSFLHLGFNCLGLWFFGRTAEFAMGPMGLLSLYMTGALAGFAGVWWKYRGGKYPRAIPNTLGASASTTALFAYFVCQNPYATVYFWFIPMPAYAVAGIVMLFGFMSGDELGGVSHSGHLGGLIGGGLFHLLSKGRY